MLAERTFMNPGPPPASSVSALGDGLPAALQEFPAASPVKFRSEDTSLESLVHHREAVDAGLPLEQAQREFQLRGVEFMAVERAGRVIGLCARGQLGFIMGSRFGFAIHSRHPIETKMVAKPLLITLGTPVRSVLDVALARSGDEFHDDVVLVDAQGRLLGLIEVQRLAQLQSRLVAEQLGELREQHEKLRQQTLELFSVNHAARQSQGIYLGLFASHTLGVALMDAEGRIREHNRRLGGIAQPQRPVARECPAGRVGDGKRAARISGVARGPRQRRRRRDIGDRRIHAERTRPRGPDLPLLHRLDSRDG
jgi:PAS domain-containing protein